MLQSMDINKRMMGLTYKKKLGVCLTMILFIFNIEVLHKKDCNKLNQSVFFLDAWLSTLLFMK